MQYSNKPQRYYVMEQKELLTVVIPVRNRATIVHDTLESVSAQTCRDFRLILVDNGSTDITMKVLTEWAGSNTDIDVTILSEPVPGVSRARNCGLSAVSTPYTLFFDSDDVMRPNHIHNVLGYLRKNPDTEILRWDVSIIDSDGWLHTKKPHFHDEMQLHLMHGTLSTQRYVAKTALFRSVGGWDESTSIMVDLELGVRLLLATTQPIKKLHGEPTVAIYNYDDDNVSGKSYFEKIDSISRTLNVIERIMTDNNRTEDLRLLRFRRAIIASFLQREGHPEAAKAIYDGAVANCSFKEWSQINLSYIINRLFGKGGTSLALLFAGKKKEKS